MHGITCRKWVSGRDPPMIRSVCITPTTLKLTCCMMVDVMGGGRSRREEQASQYEEGEQGQWQKRRGEQKSQSQSQSQVQVQRKE
jgi:hypothetical protein